jgi:hypothetical protein
MKIVPDRARLLAPFAAMVTRHLAFATPPATAQEDAADLAKKLANQVASLISFPFQINPDINLGLDDAGRSGAPVSSSRHCSRSEHRKAPQEPA